MTLRAAGEPLLTQRLPSASRITAIVNVSWMTFEISLSLPSDQGLVSDFIAAGLVSPGLSGYNSKPAFQFEYAPFSVETGLCVGATPANNTPVSLQPCGVSAKTV